jgi:hypothetical protein
MCRNALRLYDGLSDDRISPFSVASILAFIASRP